MSPKILFPEIVSPLEIFSEFQLQSNDIGNGMYRDEAARLRENFTFIKQSTIGPNTGRAIVFGYLGKNLGIKVRKSGEFWCYVQHSYGTTGTYCKLHHEFARRIVASGPPETTERAIAAAWTFDACNTTKGKTLLIGKESVGSIGFQFSNYLAEFETERFNSEISTLYSSADAEMIRKAAEHRKLVESFVNGNSVDIEGAKAAGIRVTYDKY